jgi:hypothetical protein
MLAEYTVEQVVRQAGRQAEYVVTGEMLWPQKGCISKAECAVTIEALWGLEKGSISM